MMYRLLNGIMTEVANGVIHNDFTISEKVNEINLP